VLTIGQSYLISTTVNGVFLEKQTLQEISRWMQLLFLIIAARGLLTWVNELSANAVALRVKTDLRERLFTQIIALGPSYSQTERTGELTNAAVEGIEALDAYFSQYLPQLVISTLVPLTILFIVFPIDPISGIILLLTAPLIPFFMYLIGRDAKVATKRQYETMNRLSAHFLDSLQGLTTLKLFGQAKAQIQNIAKVTNEFRVITLKVLQITFLSAFALELLATLSTALIAVEVGLRLLYRQMEFREALFLLILAPEFYLPLRMLGQRFHAGLAGTTAAKRIFNILDLPVNNVRRNEDQDSIRYLPTTSSTPFETLELSNVSYTYPGESSPILENITFSIREGKHIALVGRSGSGKTTLSNILLRFLQPTSGDIFIKGKPINKIPFIEWNKIITRVAQNPYLFHDTIAANIRLGKPEASEEEMISAARVARLEEFIESLPQKYQSVIGEGGARLSSGQAQRLSLARAFLKNTPILILDEPTSSLDPETEAILEESTHQLMRGHTLITIAHRLNTVFMADQIIVLNEGRLIEAGSHHELVSLKGEYARMVHAYGDTKFEIYDTKSITTSEHKPSPIVITRPNAISSEPNTNKRKFPIFLSLLSFLKGSWGWIALSVLFGSLTIGTSIALMGSSSWLISSAALHPSIAVLEVAIVGVRFFGIARAVFRYLERLVSHNVTFQLLNRLRIWFFEKLEPLAPARLMEYRSGDLLARIIGDINMLENFYIRVVAPPITAIIVALATSFFLAIYDPKLAVLLLGFFFILGVILPILAQRMSQQPGRNIIFLHSELNQQMVDGIQGLADILAFGRGPDRVAQISTTGKKFANSQRRMAQISSLLSGFSTFITNLALWLILLITIPQITAGQVSGVLLASLALLSLASFEAVTPLPLAAQMWSSSREAAKRLFEIVDAKPAVTDFLESETEPRISAPSDLQAMNKKLEMLDLSFTYPGSNSPALQKINFSLSKGQSVALVGPSGAGKSTLANLLLRFWDYSSGEIRLDGRSLKTFLPDDIRGRISYISQNTYFFNTSIYENLRMARRGATKEEIERAARQSQVHEYIVSLPKSYDTIIGEHGSRLSGGERQRLAIARAILKNTPILILDEPTANLDALTEKLVLETLIDLMQEKMSLLITHRLISLEKMTEILVMDRGRIVERGSQFELLNHHGLYRHLSELQNRILIET
jgi:ATP-binding cassette subfamily C protein CydCD